MKRYTILTVLLCLVEAWSWSQGSTNLYQATYITEAKTLSYSDLKDTTSLIIAANTQDGLVENDRFGRYVPSLAESWTSNADNTV